MSGTTQTATSFASRAFEVGEHLQDGTVVLSVDLEKDETLLVPAKIFAGEGSFDHQNSYVVSANLKELHGHKDWRQITDAEGEALSKAWDKVAPTELRGRAAPWFWLASTFSSTSGQALRACTGEWSYCDRSHFKLIPVVRSGPACV